MDRYVYKKLTVLAGAFLAMLALWSYNPQDPGFFHTSVPTYAVVNMVGVVGAYCADFFLSVMGYMIYIILAVTITWVLSSTYFENISLKVAARFLIVFSAGFCPILALYLPVVSSVPYGSGGMLGAYLGWHILHAVGHVGTVIFSILVLGNAYLGISELLLSHKEEPQAPIEREASKTIVKSTAKKLLDQLIEPVEDTVLQQKLRAKKMRDQPVQDLLPVTLLCAEPYPLPLDLLQAVRDAPVKQMSDTERLHLQKLVEEKLLDFGIDCRVIHTIEGPVITRLELLLAAGTKASRLTTISKDLARSLSVRAVRIVEVIPGKAYVGLELPNVQRETVYLRELMRTVSFHDSSPLTLILGKDISGQGVTVDLMKMPHLLVAGTTGSGKSVGINTMILSLLFQSSPERVKLILIDPKMLELAIYGDIPHLLTPVVTDMNDAAAALRWCVAEMERRYKIKAAVGVRNIQGFNEKVAHLKKTGAALSSVCISEDYREILDPVECVPLPYLVIVADEFADMMMVVGKKVEQLIARLAQKARAAGIHLILATQRPSVDVITGLIKANIPTRIAFQVSSKIDSRTILDQQGAEALLGQGDMLYMPPGSGMPVRIHGAFVSDDEVHRVVKHLKTLGKPDYLNLSESDESSEGGERGGGSGQDALYDEAVDFVRQAKRVSISSVQRRFRIGYNRAASLIESMEYAGVITGVDDSGQRRVLGD